MNNEALVQAVNADLALQLPSSITMQQLQEQLSDYVNNLLNTNFEKLVTLLYRIDVSEAKLKNLLQQNPQQNAGDIIADLIIERQRQKIIFREQHPQSDVISDDEKW